MRVGVLVLSPVSEGPFSLSTLSVVLALTLGLPYVEVCLSYTEFVGHVFMKGCCTLSSAFSESVEVIV